jgi:hypothetical protein
MTVLSSIQRASTAIGLAVPSSVFSSTEREHLELQDVANTVARDIADFYDWQVLKAIATITGDGTTTAWSLPSDYGRQLKKAQLWASTFPGAPLEHITDTDRWLGIVVSGFTGTVGQWTIYGDQLHIRPALALNATAKYFYQKNAIVDPASGSNKARFTIDTDVFLLDEDALELGIIYKWKRNKGLPYAEEMQDYNDRFSVRAGNDKGSKIIVVGHQRFGSGAQEYAHPWTIVP